ncbi:MAG: family N-acetyltransferase [Cypionkella sp.]|uniref:GNAT family N-acetyltransferase n=1 Tax=Cypionkella sp. TaxID=2811411 RepID=UPI002606D797|nr:GNAT family N-acetyltransferase [Cypionkella sp.]MDB5657895.1 family N-acetyltransferase [Cypionkella sp.]
MIIRPATPQDAAAMTALQNEIIKIGGTTAYEQPRSIGQILESYITGASVISCQLADDAGQVLGFQVVGQRPGLAEGWADIGTFVQPGLQARGIGAALFEASLTAARAAGLKVLNATIRADNVAGLAYYARRGFVDYAAQPEWALADGRKVGKISRRFEL